VDVPFRHIEVACASKPSNHAHAWTLQEEIMVRRSLLPPVAMLAATFTSGAVAQQEGATPEEVVRKVNQAASTSLRRARLASRRSGPTVPSTSGRTATFGDLHEESTAGAERHERFGFARAEPVAPSLLGIAT